jgi:hypothetical protein
MPLEHHAKTIETPLGESRARVGVSTPRLELGGEMRVVRCVCECLLVDRDRGGDIAIAVRNLAEEDRGERQTWIEIERAS